MPQYFCTLTRWEKFNAQVIVEAANKDEARKLARKAAAEPDWLGFEGQAGAVPEKPRVSQYVEVEEV